MSPHLPSALGPHLVQALGILASGSVSAEVCHFHCVLVSLVSSTPSGSCALSAASSTESPILEARDLMMTGLSGVSIPGSLTHERIYQSQFLLYQSQLPC